MVYDNALIYPKQQGSHCSLLKCHLSTWNCQFEWTFRCPCRGRWAVSWWPTWGHDELSGAWPGRRTGVSGTRLSKILPLFLQQNFFFPSWELKYSCSVSRVSYLTRPTFHWTEGQGPRKNGKKENIQRHQLIMIHAVDGRNPAPPRMYETLKIIMG